MQRDVAIATGRAAEHKDWSCMQFLSLSPALCWDAQKEPLLPVWAASLCLQQTANMSSIPSIWLFHIRSGEVGVRRTFIPPASSFPLSEQDSAIHSRIDHMLTLPFVCMRQCRSCPNHSRGKCPHCWIIEPESLLICHCSRDREKHLHCSNVYLLGNTKANWAPPQPLMPILSSVESKGKCRKIKKTISEN